MKNGIDGNNYLAESTHKESAGSEVALSSKTISSRFCCSPSFLYARLHPKCTQLQGDGTIISLLQYRFVLLLVRTVAYT